MAKDQQFQQLRQMFAVRFYDSVAAALVRQIEHANDGAWPGDHDEPGWITVINGLGFGFSNVPIPSFAGCYDPLDRTIFVGKYWTTERRCEIMAHELCEALLYHGAADGDLLDWPRCREECHYIARLIEEKERFDI